MIAVVCSSQNRFDQWMKDNSLYVIDRGGEHAFFPITDETCLASREFDLIIIDSILRTHNWRQFFDLLMLRLKRKAEPKPDPVPDILALEQRLSSIEKTLNKLSLKMVENK